ncbi:MAG TPA: hypothetical protein VN512_13220 [Clostridia bacterium]|nr:hypothetical protein [Clostridia bacterium]
MADQERTEIMVMLGRINEKLDTVVGNSADHEKRIRKLEGRGGRLWDILIGGVITGAVMLFYELSTK